MKLVFIAYDEAHDRLVLNLLKDAGAANYTKWQEVQGRGTSSGPHLGTPVWPKRNHALVAAVEDAQVEPILAGVRHLRDTLPQKGVKAFVLPLEQVT
ncbi:MAG TPA: transcriptional regulator [Planctomycetota bacterium]|nr:transcriptional regulator [Planctomycetota bacterium]